MMGVPSEGCTLFALSKVFPSGFSLERFFKEAALLLYCSYRVVAGLWDARLIICSHLGLCLLEVNVEQAEKQKILKFTIKSTNKATLKEYDQKSALYQTMHANKSFNKNPANHRLYHALMEALIEDENAMDKGVSNTVQDHKRKHDNDEDDNDKDPLAGPNQGKKTKRKRTKESESSKKPSTTKETPKGKSPSKGSKTSKSASAKEPVEEPIAEVVMDDACDDVVHDDDQPQDAFEPKTAKTSNPEWFTQPPRPPTPDPEWNKQGDFVDLHLNDIKDMLLLAVQHKLFHLTDSDITFSEIEFKELYTPSHKPPGVIYKDLTKQKRVMRADEQYKFLNGTLKKVRDELHHRIRDFRLEYNTEMPRRKWTVIDRKRSELMVELIDKQMRERRIIWNLERLVGARELKMDYKLMTRTT
ncbi:hypothetical protein Tco_1443824 [Tanacetum coccineum]